MSTASETGIATVGLGDRLALMSTPPAADLALSEETRARLVAAVPPNTRRAYEWAWARFTTWCGGHARSPLPATRETLAEHVTYLCAIGAAPATIDQALGVILAAHSAADVHPPSTDPARRVLRGYRRERAEAGLTPTQATPLTRDALAQCVAALDLGTPGGRRDRLLLVVGFMMMGRRSELAALTVDDVVDGADGLDVTVRWSKTDKLSEGRRVALPPQEDADLDPVRLFRTWRTELGNDGGRTPLLQRLDIHGRLAGSLSGGGVNFAVRAVVRRAGLPDAHRYSAHSLRAGGLTDALRRGVPLGIAARHGGWDPESPTVLRYARVADRWRDNAMRGAF